MKSIAPKTDFQTITKALLDNTKPFLPKFLHLFSDLSIEDFKDLETIWGDINIERRISLLSDLEQLLEADTLLCFDDVARIGLSDENPVVRGQAIRLLWESKDPHFIPVLVHLVENDPENDVRSVAAEALGEFLLMGELDEIPKAKLTEIEVALLKIVQSSTNSALQQRALESLGYSSRDEVPALLKKAYQNNDKGWMIASLLAMGRSADQSWESFVIPMLNNHDHDIQVEAIHSAGELELEKARRALINKIKEPGEDSEIRFAAIWSLSKIGGEGVRETLENLYENADEDEEEILEKALDNLESSDGTFGINFLG